VGVGVLGLERRADGGNEFLRDPDEAAAVLILDRVGNAPVLERGLVFRGGGFEQALGQGKDEGASAPRLDRQACDRIVELLRDGGERCLDVRGTGLRFDPCCQCASKSLSKPAILRPASIGARSA
jgi:hypothetical protein